MDFVIEAGERLLPIEVKATARPSSGDLASMRAFMDDLSDRAPGGVLLHCGEEVFRIADRVLAAPWWRVM